MTDQTAPSNDAANDTLVQIDFTHEEMSILLRLMGASLPLFTPLELSDDAREAVLRMLYVRGILFADVNGQYSVNASVALMVTAGVQARGIAQLNRPSQDMRDMLYVMNGFLLRQSEPLPGVVRFQVLDTPYKLVALLGAVLNLDPDQAGAPQGHPVTLTGDQWQAVRAGQLLEDVPASLGEALMSPAVVLGLTMVAVVNGQPQAPTDMLVLGHPDGGYWVARFGGEQVSAEPLDGVGAVQMLVTVLGEVSPLA